MIIKIKIKIIVRTYVPNTALICKDTRSYDLLLGKPHGAVTLTTFVQKDTLMDNYACILPFKTHASKQTIICLKHTNSEDSQTTT